MSLPGGTTLRRPDSLIRGEAVIVKKFIKLKSKFAKPDGVNPEKLVALYDAFNMKFHTYLPTKYDNKNDEYVTNLNSGIDSGEVIRIVFYGKISGANEIDILRNGEGVDETKLNGIRSIEAAEEANKNK